MAEEEPYEEQKSRPMIGVLDLPEEKAAALHENNEEEEEETDPIGVLDWPEEKAAALHENNEEEEEETDTFGVLNRPEEKAAALHENNEEEEEETDLIGLIKRLLSERIKIASVENSPLLKEACRNTGRKVILWTRRGSPLRALLVICVGTMAFLALTGWLIFMLFFLVATVNAVFISLLMSLAAAGGFLFLFFASVTAVYVAALSVAVLVISTATISAIVAVLIAAGWIGFFLTVWLVTKKSFNAFKHSLSVTASAISSYSAPQHGLNHRELDKVLD